MEREIRELEEAIGRIHSHKMETARAMENPAWLGTEPARDGMLPACADGSSAPRPHRPLETGSATTTVRLSPAAVQRPLATGGAITAERPPRTPGQRPLATMGAAADNTLRPATAPRTPAKLPKYTGTTPLEPYLSQVQIAAWHNGWSGEEAAVHLALALEGKALQVLLDLGPAGQHDYLSLTTALERRFGQRRFADQSKEQLASRRRQEGESLGTLASDVQLYVQHGYPRFDTAAQDELALHAFLQALSPERLRQHVRLTMPQSLSEALCEAERAEGIFSTRPIQQRTFAPRAHVRLAGYDEEEEEEEAEEVRQVQPPPRPPQRWPLPSRRRPSGPTNRCHRCDEPGHMARDCPAPAPKARTTQLAGNDSGAAQ